MRTERNSKKIVWTRTNVGYRVLADGSRSHCLPIPRRQWHSALRLSGTWLNREGGASEARRGHRCSVEGGRYSRLA
jgi:hypothetical protein